MSKALQVMTLLFAQSTMVTCDQCGFEVKHPHTNLPRLMRLGCPKCSSKQYTYHGLPEDVGKRILAQVPGVKQVETH